LRAIPSPAARHQIVKESDMTSSQPDKRFGVSATRLAVQSMFAVILCAGSAAAQWQYAHPAKPQEPSTTTTDTSVANVTPSRKIESHETSGNVTVDRQTVEQLGPNGTYQPGYQTETETIKVNDTTTRTIERTYQFDVNGQRNLVQQTEEDSQKSASGDSHLVRTISASDGNGNLQITRREVAETTKTSPTEQETKTTLYRVDGSGGLSATLQTQEVQTRGADNTVEEKKTFLKQDSSDHWVPYEVRENTTKQDGSNRSTDERISRADSEGKLSEVSRTVKKEVETAPGQKSTTVETYYIDSPGLTPDGKLQLIRRETTVQSANGTVQQVQQPVAGDPNSPLQVTTKTQYTVLYGGNGTQQQTRTTDVRDINGNLKQDLVETRKSDQNPAPQTQKPAPENHQ
jgi:hypothetical protein